MEVDRVDDVGVIPCGGSRQRGHVFGIDHVRVGATSEKCLDRTE
jgi:hypothetical protein